jgi:hypothetical protein
MCHVGAFGPQLKPFGRQFKLYGYVNSNGTDHFPPLALEYQTSFTHTDKDQDSSPAPNSVFGKAGPNNNFESDQVALFWGGRVTPTVGAFIQTTYDGVNNVFHWDDTDIRHSHSGNIFDVPYVAGITVNNHPTIQDLWNSTPAWGFPYDKSNVAPTPAASTLIDNALAQRVIGVGAYSMFNNLVFAEADVYAPIDKNGLNALGVVPVTGA